MALSLTTARQMIPSIARGSWRDLAAVIGALIDGDFNPFFGITAGTAAASKGLVLGSAKEAAGLGVLTGAGFQSEATAVTATADGLTTGIVPDGAAFVVVTSGNADHIVTLPAPVPGRVVRLINGATGYELRSSAPATVAINGGAAANAESAIAATTLVTCVCTSATTWIAMSQVAAGTVTATQVAAA